MNVSKSIMNTYVIARKLETSRMEFDIHIYIHLTSSGDI